MARNEWTEWRGPARDGSVPAGAAPGEWPARPVKLWERSRRQLVFKSQENIVGLDPLDGQRLWRLPYSVPEQNTIVTPLFVGDLLVTSDWDMGLRFRRIELREGAWIARQLWETRAASIFTSSPVVVRVDDGEGDRDRTVVVGFSYFNSGQLFGFDPTTGQVLWRGPGRSGEHVSLIAWGSDLLVFQEDGSLVVGRVSRDGFRPLRTYQLGRSGTWAHPAIVGNRIIIRDGDRLAAFEFSQTPK